MKHSEAYDRAHLAKEWRAWRHENRRVANKAFLYMRKRWQSFARYGR